MTMICDSDEKEIFIDRSFTLSVSTLNLGTFVSTIVEKTQFFLIFTKILKYFTVPILLHVAIVAIPIVPEEEPFLRKFLKGEHH